MKTLLNLYAQRTLDSGDNTHSNFKTILKGVRNLIKCLAYKTHCQKPSLCPDYFVQYLYEAYNETIILIPNEAIKHGCGGLHIYFDKHMWT